jgi:hypothetical protein
MTNQQEHEEDEGVVRGGRFVISRMTNDEHEEAERVVRGPARFVI